MSMWKNGRDGLSIHAAFLHVDLESEAKENKKWDVSSSARSHARFSTVELRARDSVWCKSFKSALLLRNIKRTSNFNAYERTRRHVAAVSMRPMHLALILIPRAHAVHKTHYSRGEDGAPQCPAHGEQPSGFLKRRCTYRGSLCQWKGINQSYGFAWKRSANKVCKIFYR